jgi:hypothetical protein
LRISARSGETRIVEELELDATVGRDLLSQLQILLRAGSGGLVGGESTIATIERIANTRLASTTGRRLAAPAGTSTRGGTSGVPIGIPSYSKPRSRHGGSHELTMSESQRRSDAQVLPSHGLFPDDGGGYGCISSPVCV